MMSYGELGTTARAARALLKMALECSSRDDVLLEFINKIYNYIFNNIIKKNK